MIELFIYIRKISQILMYYWICICISDQPVNTSLTRTGISSQNNLDIIIVAMLISAPILSPNFSYAMAVGHAEDLQIYVL